MAFQPIDELVVEIKSRSMNVSPEIDALSKSLGELKRVARGGAGLTSVTNQFNRFAEAMGKLTDPSGKIKRLVDALQPLGTIGKSNLGTALNQLKKIPDITNALDNQKLTEFAAKIKQVTVAVKPLADEMNKVSMGFSRLPNNIQKAINANARLTRSNRSTAFGFNMLAGKVAIYAVALRRIGSVLGSWIRESTSYVENLNLFTASMGEYAQEAQRYAEHVGDLLGIDPSSWMRNQGVFNTLISGFGVAADKAALMSKNLTQLGYDLSSFYNITVSDAMQKVQAGISGELEPLRRLGFDLSKAKLQAIALAHGIEKTFNEMTQAEKSQLRYYAVMTQVTVAQGDMARTLEAPANQLRILSAQATQAARALGNIFIPALNAVLPYAIAFLKVVRWVADELARLFGFSLPEIDYSGIERVAGGAEDLADGMNDAANAAEKLRRTIFGFDQLNLMAGPQTTGGAGASSLGYDLGLPLPEYDFLGGLIESRTSAIFKSWKESVEPVLNFIVDNFETIKTIAIAIGGVLLAWKVGTAISTLFTQVSGMAGKTIGVALSILGVAIGTSGVAEMASGKGDIYSLIKAAIGTALGVGGALLTFGTGPLGWTVGIGLTLVMTIVGVQIAAQEKIAELVDKAMSSGGTTITELSNAFGKVMQGISSGYGPIIANAEKLKEARRGVKEATDAMQVAFDLVNSGAKSAEESIDIMKNAFEELIQSTERLRDQAYDNITYALSTTLKDTANAMGVDVSSIIFQLDRLNAKSKNQYEKYMEQASKLQQQYKDGKISTHEWLTAHKKLVASLNIGTSATQEVDNEFHNLMITLKSIDWESEADRSKALLWIGDSAKRAQQSTDEFLVAMKDNISELRKFATTDEDHIALDEVLGLTTADTTAASSKIAQNLGYVHSVIQSKLLGGITSVVEKAKEEWAGKNFFERIAAGGSEAEYVRGAILQYKSAYVDPFLQQLEPVMKEFGAKGAPLLSNAMQTILDEGFTWSHSDITRRTMYKNDLVELIRRIIADAEREINRNPFKIAAKIDIQNPTIRTTGGAYVGKMVAQAYATGGFPDPGELFLAREAGPELVGRVGGRTAVMNNDQIVEAVAKGIADYIGKVKSEGGDIHIYIDGVLAKSLSAIDRKNTRAGRTVIPVEV